MTRIRRLLPDILALLGLVAILILSFVPRKFSYPDAPLISPDLVGHFGCYFLVGICALFRRDLPANSRMTFAGLVLFGGIVELLQSQFGRNADVMDFLANTLGVWAALMVVPWLRKHPLAGALTSQRN